MTDPQGPGGGALDPHAYFIPPSTSKAYHHQNGISDLTQSHITLLKNSSLPPSWLPPTSEADHPRLSDAFSEMRYLELNNCWDLNSYSEGLTARLVDTRSIDNPDTPINYRPWEKPDSSTQQQTQHQVPPPPSTPTTTAGQSNGHSAKHENGVSSTNSPENKSPPTLTPLTNAFPTFTDAFAPPPPPPPPQKLPSFQSQFNAFTDNPPPSHALEHTLPSFHTLPANTRYPGPPPPHTAPPPHSSQLQHAMVPAGLAHREPQPFLEDRHIQLFPGQVPLPHTPHHHQFPATLIATTQNGGTHPQATYHVQMNGAGTYATPTTGVMTPATATIQLQELVPVPPMHTLLHPAAINVPRSLNSTDPIPGLNVQLLDTHFAQQSTQNTLKYMHNSSSSDLPQPPPPQTHVIAVKLQPYETPKHNNNSSNNNERVNGHVNGSSPPQQQQQQHQQQPITPRSTNTTSTPKRQGKRKRHDQNGTLNGHDTQNAHQVSSVSSTEPGYKRPNLGMNGIKHVNGHTNGHDPEMDKPVKKKRKRCGECIGCQRKDNCGECAPCRNDKSHQICKQRRCDKLTEKKTPKSKLKQQQQQQQQQQQIQQPHHHQ